MSKTKTKAKKKPPARKRSRAVSNQAPHASNEPWHPRVLISGYYGFDNLGDELILKVLIDELKRRDVAITVLSKNPEQTRATYGVDAISRTNIIDIIDALAQSNLFISGGGGLFQDATGPMSTIYYGGLIHLAHFFEVPVCFWAQGVGPLKKPFARKMTVSALEKCDMIVVRDEGSAHLIEEMSGFRPEVTADPVWLLKLSQSSSSAKAESKAKADKAKSDKAEDKKKPSKAKTACRIGISLRPWPELTQERLEALALCLQNYARSLDRAVEFRLLPFQSKEDTELLENFSLLLQQKGTFPATIASAEQAVAEVGQCDMLLGMRFHSLILALLQGVPVYGLVYDPKVASLLEMFGLQGSVITQLGALMPDLLKKAFEQYPPIDLTPFQQQAQRNFEVLDQFLATSNVKLAL